MEKFKLDRNLFCIDHCREGRLEYPATDDAYSYVEAGDLKFDRRLTHTGHFEMPLSHYHGAMVAFDMDEAAGSLLKEVKDFPVNLRSLQKKFCSGIYPYVVHGEGSTSHIFEELYAVPEKIKRPYFKIKILELLLYLEALELPEGPDEKPYFYRTQVEKVKAVQQQAGMVDPKRYIGDMVLKSRVEMLEQQVRELKRENERLEKEKKKLEKALDKKEMNFIKNL